MKKPGVKHLVTLSLFKPSHPLQKLTTIYWLLQKKGGKETNRSCVMLVGTTGTGKTTLLNIFTGAEVSFKGHVSRYFLNLNFEISYRGRF
jgi:hypothetical protein